MSFLTFHRGGTVFIQSRARTARPRRHLVDRRAGADRLSPHRRRRVRAAAARRARPQRRTTCPRSPCCSRAARRCRRQLKQEFLSHLPALIVVDGLGSSEAGGQMQHVSAGGAASTGTFMLSAGNHVLSADLTRELGEGDDEIGWLAKSGRLALGYLGDAEKTARTYPTVNGVRYAVPGDRARGAARRSSSCTAATPSRSTRAARRSSPRRSSTRSATIRPSTTSSSRRGRPIAGARRSSRSSACATASRRRLTRGRAARGEREAHRPLQVAQGVRLRRRGRAIAVGQGRLPLGAHDRRRLTPTPAFCVAKAVSFGGPRDRERQWGRGSPGARPARDRDPRGGHRHAGVGRSKAATGPDRRRAVSGVRAPDVACLPQLQALRRGSHRALMA